MLAGSVVTSSTARPESPTLTLHDTHEQRVVHDVLTRQKISIAFNRLRQVMAHIWPGLEREIEVHVFEHDAARLVVTARLPVDPAPLEVVPWVDGGRWMVDGGWWVVRVVGGG